MMILNVLIDASGNAAFEDYPGAEFARILRKIADSFDAEDLRYGMRPLRDRNGNTVGQRTFGRQPKAES
jgi:hypothetical protein